MTKKKRNFVFVGKRSKKEKRFVFVGTKNNRIFSERIIEIFRVPQKETVK